jgi:glucuronide carrier protein
VTTPATAVETAPADEQSPRLGRSQLFGYGAGDAANNLAFAMTSMFLLLYYTDVVGLAATTVGTLFLVVRVFDGFADLFAGRVVDRTSTRWGKFRPYLLFASAPLLLLNVAVFSVPDLSVTGTLVYAYVTYALFGLMYSLVNIPYGSLATAITQDPTERSRLATYRVIGSNVAILLLALVVSPQIEGSSDLQRSLTITTMGLFVVGMALYLFCFFTSKEQVRAETPTATLRETAAAVKNNKALMVLCGSAVLFLLGWFSLQTVTVYYARDVLGNADLYAVLVVVQTAGIFTAAAFLPRVVQAMGKKRAYALFGGVAIVGAVGVALAPASTPAIAIVLFGVLGVGLGGLNTSGFALQPDTIEYGEWQSGFRNEGAAYSVFSFTRKVGQALGAAAASYAIGLGGYVSGAASQPSSAADAIRVAVGVVPAVFILASIAVMAAYPLTEDRFRQIVRELAERRAAGVRADRGDDAS